MGIPGFFTRTAPYRWAFEPALAVVITLVWGTAAFVFGVSSSLLLVILLAVAVAISRLFPAAALGVAAVAALVTVTASGGILGDVAALALLFVSGCLIVWNVCLGGQPIVRYVALGAGLLFGAILTGLLVVTITVPDRNGIDAIVAFVGELALRLTGGFLLTAVLVAGWVAGLVLRGRADRREAEAHLTPEPLPGAELTAETWLMLSPTPAWPADSVVFAGRRGFRPLPRRTLVIDLGIAGGFVLFGLLTDPYTNGLTVPVLAALAIALAVRRLSPVLALAVAWIAALSQMLAGLPVLASDLAILAVLYATAAYAERIVRWAGLVSVGVGALLAAGYLSVTQRGATSVAEAVGQGDVGGLVWSMVAIFVACLAVLGLSWTLGLLMRTWQTARAGRFSQNRALEEQRAAQRSVVVEQERNRIARDMHDVVAHSLAVVIAQADGARYARAQNPEAVDAALTTISTTARDALGDVRILLTRLRQDDAAGPQPVLADLDRLVDQMRSTGLDIDWTTTGLPTTLGSGAQLAVYRIVQEALTNALRHGDAGRAVYLSLAWTDGWVTVTIDNAIRTTPEVGQAGEIGHGLPGMRERAILAGGSLNAEAVGDRFIVSGRLPAVTTSAIVRPEVPAQSGPNPGGPILGSKTLGPTGPGSTAATGTGAEV
jgi:signal transduction histidine kinase